MADLTRPVASHLPPEITSRILHYIPLQLEHRSKVAQEYQSISVLARISGSFRLEVQQKLFSAIYLVSIDQLRKLVDNLSLGLLQQTKSLRFDKIILESEYSSLIFSVLQSTKNLQHSQIDRLPSSFSFNAEQSQMMRKIVMLPLLKSLNVQLDDLAILDPLVSTAPDIEKLTVATQRSYLPYQGVPFTSHLDKLKELTLYGGAGTAILEGTRWRLNEFQGLTFLKLVDVKVQSLTTFSAFIGPNLLEARLENIHPSLGIC